MSKYNFTNRNLRERE